MIPDYVYKFSKSFVDTMFKDLQDPKMRGANFSWNGFPALASRMASVHVFMIRKPMSDKRLKFIQRSVEIVSKDYAEKLIKESGLT